MTTTKDRSYRLHEQIADDLGQPRYAHGYRPNRPVTLDDGTTGTLVSTSNVGFSGILGTVVLDDGTRRSISLGEIASLR